MKNFKPGDKVSFSGNAEYPEKLEETVVAHSNNEARQAIIEHPEGHDGDEFSNVDLDPKKKYLFVKTDHLELVEASETVETVVAEKVETKPTEPAYHPPSKILSVVAQSRPTTEDGIWQKLIALALKEEQKIKTAEKKEAEKIAEKEAEEKRKQEQERDQQNAALLSEGAQERLKKQAQELENIKSLVKRGIDAGYVVLDGRTAFIAGQPVYSEAEDDAIATVDGLANFFQNTRDEFSAFSLAMIDIAQNGYDPEGEKAPDEAEKTSEATEEGKSEEKTDDTAGEKSDDGEDGKEKTDDTADEKSDHGADEKKETSPGVQAQQYKDKLLSLPGVGPKSVEDIINFFPTKEDLLKGYADKKISFNSKVDKALKDACKSGYFA